AEPDGIADRQGQPGAARTDRRAGRGRRQDCAEGGGSRRPARQRRVHHADALRDRRSQLAARAGRAVRSDRLAGDVRRRGRGCAQGQRDPVRAGGERLHKRPCPRHPRLPGDQVGHGLAQLPQPTPGRRRDRRLPPFWPRAAARRGGPQRLPGNQAHLSRGGHRLTHDILFEAGVVALCLAAGGVLKGATGAGAPLLAVPALAAFFDVRFAVVVMLIPNLATNAWQAVRYRRNLPEGTFTAPLLLGGVVGIILGTLALKNLQSSLLSLVMAAAVLGYVALRLARPHWRLEMAQAKWLALPAGTAAGALQGAAGLSAPVSITFLNAMQMGRERFIAAISALFVTFTIVQLLAISLSGLLGPR